MQSDERYRLLQAQADDLREERDLLRQNLEDWQQRLAKRDAESAAWAEESKVWEATQRTLTEDCWELRVVKGDLDHPDNRLEWSEQFRALVGRGGMGAGDDWQTYVEIIHPDDMARVLKVFSHHLKVPKNPDTYVTEYRLRHTTEGYLWFRERGRFIWVFWSEPSAQYVIFPMSDPLANYAIVSSGGSAIPTLRSHWWRALSGVSPIRPTCLR